MRAFQMAFKNQQRPDECNQRGGLSQGSARQRDTSAVNFCCVFGTENAQKPTHWPSGEKKGPIAPFSTAHGRCFDCIQSALEELRHSPANSAENDGSPIRRQCYGRAAQDLLQAIQEHSSAGSEATSS